MTREESIRPGVRTGRASSARSPATRCGAGRRPRPLAARRQGSSAGVRNRQRQRELLEAQRWPAFRARSRSSRAGLGAPGGHGVGDGPPDFLNRRRVRDVRSSRVTSRAVSWNVSIQVSYESASKLSEAEKNASWIRLASSARVMALSAATSRSRFSGQTSSAVPKATSPGMSIRSRCRRRRGCAVWRRCSRAGRLLRASGRHAGLRWWLCAR